MHAHTGPKAHAHGLIHGPALAHSFGSFPFHVIVEIARQSPAGARIQRLFHCLGERDVFDVELGQFQPVLVDHRVDGLADQFRYFAGVGGHVQHGNPAAGDVLGKLLHDDVADLKADFIHREFAVRADDFSHEDRWIRHLDRIGAKGPDAGRPKFRVAQHDRVLGAPFEVGKAVGVDEIDLGLERRLKRVIPVLQRGHDRHVVGLEHIETRGEHVCHLAFVDKDRRLTFAHRQFGTVFDFVTFPLKAVDQCVACVVRPVDDVDELSR